MAEKTVFISHTGDEAPVAQDLQHFIDNVFGAGFTFVSSDYASLRGDDDWYPAIVRALKASLLFADESPLFSGQEHSLYWIREAASVLGGEGSGRRSTVVNAAT